MNNMRPEKYALPYKVTADFESALAQYAGAPYAVAVNSGTAALLLAVQWHSPGGMSIEIPARTYCSVPMAIIHAGGRPVFRDYAWRGAYQLNPLPVFDSARRFTSSMYSKGTFICVSFAASKILAAEQGGAILHDDPEADAWFRRMRFDGRTEGVDPLYDNFREVGHHCLMIPSVAATLLVRLHHLPKHNEDMPDYVYPDLSQHKAFQ